MDGPAFNCNTNNTAAFQIPAHTGPDVPHGANQLAAYYSEENHTQQLKHYGEYKTAHKLIKDAVLAATLKLSLQHLLI